MEYKNNKPYFKRLDEAIRHIKDNYPKRSIQDVPSSSKKLKSPEWQITEPEEECPSLSIQRPVPEFSKIEDPYDKKYGIDSRDPKVQKLHSKRRMFAIKDGEVHISPLNVTYTHAKWFENLGWITPEDDELMEMMVRGFSDSTGLYFYIGYDFSIDEESEKIMLNYLEVVVDKLSIPLDLHLFGGLIKDYSLERWPPRKDYGPIESIIKMI